MLVNGIGLCASMLSFLIFIPQATTTWALRNNPEALKGTSTSSLYLLLGNAALWLVYAVLTQAWWSGAPSLVNGPLAVFMLLVKRRNRSKEDI